MKTEPQKPKQVEIRCAWCEKEILVPAGSGRKYCSECAMPANHAQIRENNRKLAITSVIQLENANWGDEDYVLFVDKARGHKMVAKMTMGAAYRMAEAIIDLCKWNANKEEE